MITLTKIKEKSPSPLQKCNLIMKTVNATDDERSPASERSSELDLHPVRRDGSFQA